MDFDNESSPIHVIGGELGTAVYVRAGTLRCSGCGCCCTSGKDLERHLREAHSVGLVGFTCGCCNEKKFERLTQVSCHYPRCKGRSPVRTTPNEKETIEKRNSGDGLDPGTMATAGTSKDRGDSPSQTRGSIPLFNMVTRKRCEQCDAEFDSQRGLSQHQRVRHPKSYQTKLAADDRKKRKGYEQAELMLLAEAEVDVPQSTRFVNIALDELGIVDRTREQIRQIRKLEGYRQIVDDLIRARSEVQTPLVEDYLDPVTSAPESEVQNHVGEEYLDPAPTPSLRDILPEFNPNDDRRYRQLLDCAITWHAQDWPETSIEKLDETLRCLYPFIQPRGKSRVERPRLQDWRDGNLSSRQRKQVRYRTTRRVGRGLCEDRGLKW